MKLFLFLLTYTSLTLLIQYIVVRYVLVKDFLLCMDIDFKDAVLDDKHLDDTTKKEIQKLYYLNKPTFWNLLCSGTLSRKQYFPNHFLELFFVRYSSTFNKAAPETVTEDTSKTNRRYHLHRHLKKIGIRFNPDNRSIFLHPEVPLENKYVKELVSDHKYSVQYEIQ